MGALVILGAWLALAFVGALAMVWWSIGVWRRRTTLRLPTKIITVLVAASAAAGGLGTTVGLVRAFRAIGGESADPSRKARIVAEGISEAMNCTALGLVIGAPSAIVLAIVMKRRNAESNDGP